MKPRLECLEGISAISKTSLTSRKVAKSIAAFASEKKAEDIVILDMRKIVNYCDYFVLCSGNNDRHVKATAESIEDGLSALGLKSTLRKGMKDSAWIVFDTGDVVAHIFQKDIREFYQLEYLWREAKEIKWEDS